MKTDLEREAIEAAIKIGTDLGRLKGEMAAATIVICHLLHSATDEAKTEARVALRLGAQRWMDQGVASAIQDGFAEAMTRYRA